MVASAPVWEKRSLREVVTKLVDGSHNPPPKQDAGLPMLSARNIDRGQVLFDDYRLISESAFVSENARTRIAAGDVLLTIVGTIGRTAVVPEGSQPFSLQRSVAVLTPAANLLPKFLCYQLQSPAIQKHFEANARGTAQKGVYLKTLGQTPIVLPPVEVQVEIVAEVEKQFSRLDEAVANLQRVKANLKRYKASVLKDAVEGRLVPTEAELARREGRTFETGEQLLQRIAECRRQQWIGRGKYKEAQSKWIGNRKEVPEGWCWATVNDLAVKIVDGTHHTPTYVDAGVPFISVKDIRDGRINFESTRLISVAEHDDLSKRCNPEFGDVLITKSGTIGRTAIVTTNAPFSLFVSVALIKPVKGIFDPRYLMLTLDAYIQSIDISQDVKGGLLKNLHLEDLKLVSLQLPPAAEQARIVAEVDRHLSIVREVEAEVDANLQRAQALRQAILTDAFGSNGLNTKVTVSSAT